MLTDEDLVFAEGMLSRWVRLPNGARAHYMTAGESGPAVVLLHGGLWGSSGAAGWNRLATSLGSHGFRVYCPDMPGYGLADSRPEYWSRRGLLDNMDFLQQLADTLCLDEFHIAGNSGGCVNAATYLCDHPERVLSAVLIAGAIPGLVPPAGPPSDPSKIPEVFRNNPLSEPWSGTADDMRAVLETIVLDSSTITDELLEMRCLAAERQADALVAFFTGYMQKTRANPNWSQKLDLGSRITEMTTPIIYIHGQQDTMSPVHQAHAMEDAAPNIQFFYPDNTGHQAQTDQPELLSRLFREFWSDEPISAATATEAGISTRRPVLAELVATD